MKTRLLVVALVAIALASAVAAVVHGRMGPRPLSTADREALIRTDQYCAKVRVALEQDAADLLVSDTDRRIAAEDRFMEPISLHSWDDLELCGGDSEDIDHLECGTIVDYDDSCIARQVRRAISSLRPESTAWELPLIHERCSAVRMVMQEHARELKAGKPDRLRGQLTFGSMSSLHSPVEIQLCSPTPPSLNELEGCRRANDYACLARIARAAEKSIYVPLDRD